MRCAIVTMGKLLSPPLVILSNKIHQRYEMRPLDDKIEGTRFYCDIYSDIYTASTVIYTVICSFFCDIYCDM